MIKWWHRTKYSYPLSYCQAQPQAPASPIEQYHQSPSCWTLFVGPNELFVLCQIPIRIISFKSNIFKPSPSPGWAWPSSAQTGLLLHTNEQLIYLAHFSSKWKNKNTFKVEVNKVVLFFYLSQNERDMAIYLISKFSISKLKSESEKNGQFSLNLSWKEKLRTLSFL